jgi:hypothetical protein
VFLTGFIVIKIKVHLHTSFENWNIFVFSEFVGVLPSVPNVEIKAVNLTFGNVAQSTDH